MAAVQRRRSRRGVPRRRSMAMGSSALLLVLLWL
jgi:hypothetical protein